MRVINVVLEISISVFTVIGAEPVSDSQLNKPLFVTGLSQDIDNMPDMFAASMQEANGQIDALTDEKLRHFDNRTCTQVFTRNIQILKAMEFAP
ncbi:hypothetical protein [Flavobacterium sp. W21_SRS_FM6]|uniref:hypothetical protein n=1 Tax=Flavobacterium sp. W21_SRS_FM6 TaxID=3240268 RepID=UPI003F8E9DA9